MPEFDGKPQVLEDIKSGRYSFILNDKGEFAADHMARVNPKLTLFDSNCTERQQ